MRKPFHIGEKLYQTKKEALLHYKTILNSYDFDEVLADDDFNALLDLIIYDEAFDEKNSDEIATQMIVVGNDLAENEIEEEEILIQDIKIGKSQFDTKCFELLYNDSTTQYFSYTLAINRPQITDDRLFNKACRNTIQNDIILLKQQYFKNNTAGNGHVKCQETGELCKWDELVVDHRQPNTLSMIIERFKELNNINSTIIKYFTNEKNLLMFMDFSFAEKFRCYHNDKANLRVVKKERNSSRVAMGRIKQNNKDLKIK